ncbi:MAG: hypothetical protein OEO21_06670 [Candidatus Krumholzibacteria bacterium]|nr:hypothetical protein [Candidatus Krumholzibacteria bacterium]
MRQIAAFIVATLVGGPAGLLAAAPGEGGRVVAQQSRETPARGEKTAEADEDVRGAMDVFADIEKAWSAENVDRIVKHFGSARVAISIEGTGPSGGKFSRSQSYYLLKDLFAYTITRKFEFVQYRKPEDDGLVSFAIAERHYQKTDDGRLFKDKIYVALHVETASNGERWVIDEIKSIR